MRLYEFLSQIVPYEDRELEQLCVFAKHLHPLLRVDRLQQDDVDVGELQRPITVSASVPSTSCA